MKKTILPILLIICLLLLQGCETLGHQKFYNQVAPIKYPPTEKVIVFEYSNVDINEIYELLYSDFLIVGKSSFNGPYENPTKSISYAESIGTDVFITTSQFKETRTSFFDLSLPTTTTTNFSGYTSSGSFFGSATSYGIRTTTLPVTVNRYNQKGLYLRNVNNVKPLWERKKTDYQKTGLNELEGVWYNNNYEVELFLSGNQIVGFLTKKPIDKDSQTHWDSGDIKLLFNPEKGVGIYLMGDKTPMPSKIKVNKFGHLEVDLILVDEKFSFAKR